MPREYKTTFAHRQSAKKWRERHRQETIDWQRSYHTIPEVKRKARNKALKRKYGITLVQMNEMIDRQGGCCALCRAPFPSLEGKNVINVDHDHETGRIRGILCNTCNKDLGRFGDNAAGLLRAYEYVAGIQAEPDCF